MVDPGTHGKWQSEAVQVAAKVLCVALGHAGDQVGAACERQGGHEAAYAGALGLITAGYASFQSANNTAVMASATADQRGVVSGLLNLSRKLGLITGASAMGAVFSFGASTTMVATASAEQLTAGLRLTFFVAAALVALGGVLTRLGATASRRFTPQTHTAEARA